MTIEDTELDGRSSVDNLGEDEEWDVFLCHQEATEGPYCAEHQLKKAKEDLAEVTRQFDQAHRDWLLMDETAELRAELGALRCALAVHAEPGSAVPYPVVIDFLRRLVDQQLEINALQKENAELRRRLDVDHTS